MQQETGLRLKRLGGRLAWGRLPISLVYRATEWSSRGIGCATPFASPGEGLEAPIINLSLLTQNLFSAIYKPIRHWPNRFRDFNPYLHLLDVRVWDLGKCRPAKDNAALWLNFS